MRIWNLNNAPLSNRSGTYGGNAGQKEGILLNGENWIVKYPKSSRALTGKDLPSYVSSPLSEFVGSHIYQLLGYEAHDTILGYRRGKIVVVCKDFCADDEQLLEMRTLKNMVIERDGDFLGESNLSITGDSVDLQNLLTHLRENPIIKQLDNPAEAERHFWETSVIDIYMDNNDRNNGNRGLIYNKSLGSYRVAPVYDNGNSFSTKATEAKLLQYITETKNQKIVRSTGSRTPYFLNGHQLSAKKFLALQEAGLADAVLTVVPNIKQSSSLINDFIDTLPQEAFGLTVCSDTHKKYFKMSLAIRLENMLQPALEKAEQERKARDFDVDIDDR